MNSFYSVEELTQMGFKSLGGNGFHDETLDICVSRKASIYSPEKISLGNHVRIDDFCILSGDIEIGNYVHIAAYCALFGGDKGIEMKDFSGLSSRCVIYAVSDDYSGENLTNPTVPQKYTGVTGEKVVLEKHVIVGTGCSIMPGVVIHEGSAVGSMSLVNKSIDGWGIYVGIPCKKVKDRSKEVLQLETELLGEAEYHGV